MLSYGGMWGGVGGVSVPRGHDLKCLLFCSYALTPAKRQLTNPLDAGAVLRSDTVAFSCISRSLAPLLLF